MSTMYLILGITGWAAAVAVLAAYAIVGRRTTRNADRTGGARGFDVAG